MQDEFLPTINVKIILPEGKLDKTRYILLDDFEFSGVLVPKGFITDGATIPRIFWPILPPVHRYFPAAIVHDFCLTQTSRKLADLEFKIALKKLNISKFRRILMHSAVRAYSYFKR